MKKLIFLILSTLLTSPLCAQQVSLYDRDGEARAYIDYDEDGTIFMWDGTPVAFIEEDGNDLCVFGFNRSFLGWIEDGIIYDKYGYAVNVSKCDLRRIPKFENLKGFQKFIPLRPLTPLTPFKPFFKRSWSNITVTDFLLRGKK